MGERLARQCLESRVVSPDGRNYHQVMAEFDNEWGDHLRQVFCEHTFHRDVCRDCGVHRTGIQI